MGMSKLEFRAEPRDGVYRHILEYSLETCATFLFVYRRFEEMSEGVRDFRKQLLGFIVDETVVSTWPGTMLTEASAVLGCYCLERGSVEILAQAADGLYDWGRFGSGVADEVDLPEDLCLMRPDGTPWLVSCGHEEFGYFRVTEQERSALLATIPQLGNLLK